MIIQTNMDSGRSVAATVPTAAISALSGETDTGFAASIVLPRFSAEYVGHVGTNDESHNKPGEYLAQFLAPSPIDYFEGNQQ
ncbi:hypothetical protein PWG15_22505 (plasmid) [Ensifer adhaerens]|uniref:hypothetical protein n=1 Tax=Ensifer adhaerens TaxID=106592 RepID=UPI0023A9CB27|nr:hypothetical protein [Ensifer adhaerens]WDZ80556.1 hypothetical protein PWG15_22505 [Ensifer adhaerens]